MGTLLALALAVVPVQTDELESAFLRVLEAGPKQYQVARDAFLRHPAAREFLEAHARQGPSTEARALAAALAFRLEHPQIAQTLDGWEPSAHATRYHNPFPFIRKEMRAAFQAYPSMAYERLSRDPSRQNAQALLEIIATGPEGLARLQTFLTTLPEAAPLLVEMAPAKAAQPLLGALKELPDPTSKNDLTPTALLNALGKTTTHRKDVLAALHHAFRSRQRAQYREAVIRSLAALGDKTLVEPQLDAMADLSLTTAIWEALGTLLGPDELQRRLVVRAQHPQESVRLAAATALALGGKPTAKVHAMLLGSLLVDPSANVRSRAAQSMSTLSISARGVPFPRTAERALLAASADSVPEVRRWALNALWRVVVEKNRSLSLGMQNVVAAALSAQEKLVFNSAAHRLDTFFGKEAGLILLMLLDTQRIEDRRPYDYGLQEGRKTYSKAAPANVAKLCQRYSGLRDLCQRWARAKQ